MPLVEYDSDSDSDGDPKEDLGDTLAPRADAKRKLEETTSKCNDREPGPDMLPPLPAAFHDLYASTVRTSTVDDPSLHQGRSRQIPHVAGNWPSHIYIEWIPKRPEYDLLQRLFESLQGELQGTSGAMQHSFLTSDLGAPLPLHISLSRPFVLKTPEKDGFLEEFVESIKAAYIKPLTLDIRSLAWHRSPDTNRSFLVLRMEPHTELSNLLNRSNDLVAAYGQPRLYASADGKVEEVDAFHVSIAWSFGDPKPLEAQTSEVFARSEFQKPITDIKVGVDQVKVKIGNVITSIDLDGANPAKKRKRSLFGV